MNVKLIKLINGQELVAEILSEQNASITVKRPFVVHMMRDQQGNPSLGFGEWSLLMESDKPATVHKHAMVADPLDVLPEIVHSYEQQVSSIILPTPPAGNILLG